MGKSLTATYTREDPNPVSTCTIKKNTRAPTTAMHLSHNPPAHSDRQNFKVLVPSMPTRISSYLQVRVLQCHVQEHAYRDSSHHDHICYSFSSFRILISMLELIYLYIQLHGLPTCEVTHMTTLY